MTTRTSAQAGKFFTPDAGLPPELSALLHRTTSLASSNPAAMEALQAHLPRLYAQVAEASRKQHPLQPGLQPTAQTRAGISYLQRVLDTYDYADLDERMLMIDRVGLNDGMNPDNNSTVAEFGSAELLGTALNDDRVCEMHGGDDEDGIVGSEIEVFCVREDCWMSAFVVGVCDGGYFVRFCDGAVERVSLANRAWRLVA